MPRLSAEVVTTTEVELKPTLLKQLKMKLTDLRELTRQKKLIEARIGGGKDAEGEEIPGLKAEIETLFADSGEYEALVAGVRIDTPFGAVPVKMVRPEESKGALNMKKLCTKLYVKRGSKYELATLADIDACRDKPKPKKEYLGVYLPREGDEGGEDE